MPTSCFTATKQSSFPPCIFLALLPFCFCSSPSHSFQNPPYFSLSPFSSSSPLTLLSTSFIFSLCLYFFLSTPQFHFSFFLSFTYPTPSFFLAPRDGEDLDELLERQADMIRYLQQHNANLGRRILELQAQAME